MFKYIAEAIVAVRHSEAVAEKIFAHCAGSWQPTGGGLAGRLLDFGGARAILKPNADGLHLQVEAEDVVMFYGVRSVVEGCMLKSTAVPRTSIEWRQTSGNPLEPMRRPAANRRNRSG